MTFDLPGVKPGSNLDNLFKAAGFMVIQWGHCEQSLELLVNTIFTHYGGSKLPGRKKMPRQLTDKINFIKESTEQIPALEPFKEVLTNLIGAFEQVNTPPPEGGGFG